MKVIDEALEKLPASASRIASALDAAAGTIAREGDSFAAEVEATATGLRSDFAAVLAQLESLPDLLDPAPILAQCTASMEQAAGELRTLAVDAAGIPTRLAALASRVQPVIDQGREALASVCAMPAHLGALLMQLEPQIEAIRALPARGIDLANRASAARGFAEAHAHAVLPTARRLAGLAEGDATARSIRAEIAARLEETTAQLESLEKSLGKDADDIAAIFDDAIDAGLRILDDGRARVGQQAEALLAPLQFTLDAMDQVRTSIGSEAATCLALFDDSRTKLDRLGEQLREPLAIARAQFDAVATAIEVAGASIDSMIRKALQPLDALEAHASDCVDALGTVVDAAGMAITDARDMLDDLDTRAEQAKADLVGLPGQFDPVRDAIDRAVTQVLAIKERIPLFVAQADGALVTAGAEIDQAESRCNDAIDVCTRYMIKVPPLMAARTLFLGVRAAIPGIRSAIADGRDAVRTAGASATELLDEAAGAVQATEPALDTALVPLRDAIDQLSELVTQLQLALRDASNALEAIPDQLDQAVDAARAAIRTVLDQVRTAAEDCVETLQAEALVQQLREQLQALADRTLTPLWQQVAAASAPLGGAMERGKTSVGDAVRAIDTRLLGVAVTIASAQTQAKQPLDALDNLLADARHRWESLADEAMRAMRTAGTGARAICRDAMAHVASLTDMIDAGTLTAESIEAAIARSMASLDSRTSDLGLNDGFATLLGPLEAEARDLSSQFVSAPSTQPGVVAGATSDPNSLGEWQHDAERTLAGTTAAMHDATQAAVQAALAADRDVRSAGEDVMAVSASFTAIDSVAGEIESAFAQMTANARLATNESAASLTSMKASLEQASEQAANATKPVSDSSEQARSTARPGIDDATVSAQRAREAEASAAAAIATAGDRAGSIARDALARTEALKDDAQAGIDASRAEVQHVGTLVESARTDCIAAEARLDAAVAARGGEPLPPARVANAAEDATTSPPRTDAGDRVDQDLERPETSAATGSGTAAAPDVSGTGSVSGDAETAESRGSSEADSETIRSRRSTAATAGESTVATGMAATASASAGEDRNRAPAAETSRDATGDPVAAQGAPDTGSITDTRESTDSKHDAPRETRTEAAMDHSPDAVAESRESAVTASILTSGEGEHMPRANGEGPTETSAGEAGPPVEDETAEPSKGSALRSGRNQQDASVDAARSMTPGQPDAAPVTEETLARRPLTDPRLPATAGESKSFETSGAAKTAQVAQEAVPTDMRREADSVPNSAGLVPRMPDKAIRTPTISDATVEHASRLTADDVPNLPSTDNASVSALDLTQQDSAPADTDSYTMLRRQYRRNETERDPPPEALDPASPDTITLQADAATETRRDMDTALADAEHRQPTPSRREDP